MRRVKIMILGLLTVVAAVVGSVAVVVPDAGAATCADPAVCVELNPGSTPECTVCHAGERCQFIVGLSWAIVAPETVGYATVNGTALAGVHFAGVSDGRLTIPAGATRGSFTIEVFPGVPGTPSTVFYVVLTSVSTGSIGNGRTEVHIPGTSRMGLELGHSATHL